MSQRSRAPTLRSRRHLLMALAAVITTAACELQSPTGPPVTSKDPAALSNPPIFLAIVHPIGAPLSLLTSRQRLLFERGRAEFQAVFTPATGLGPLFNNVSCASCHEAPVVGGVGEEVETHQSAFNGSSCNDLSAIGGPVSQDSVTPALHSALNIDKEPLLPEATGTAHRTTPSLLGFGLLEAVPDVEILALAAANNRDGDGIAGRPNRTADGRLGRFGRKAQAATLREFNADAFVMEMGITNPFNQTEQTVGGLPFPAGIDPLPEPEIGADQLDAADAFVRFLAPPPHVPLDFASAIGAVTFRRIGCAACHVPALVTGANPVPALRFRVVPAFTDLLLHDMGPDLADICLGEAQPSEFRTEPLMGLRFATAFLHDGRAATISQAIELHGGEGQRARNRFMRLTPLQRRTLLRFLRTL